MNLQDVITKTLQPPVIPALLTQVTSGSIVVAACFERGETLDSTEEYEDDDSYDSYWIFKFEEQADKAYADARAKYEEFLERSDLITASICVTLDSTD